MTNDLYLQPVTGHAGALQVLPVPFAMVSRGAKELRRTGGTTLPTFQLTERDRGVLAALHRLRVLTTPLIQTHHYQSYRLTCRRLRYLYLHNFIVRLVRPSLQSGERLPAAYRLGKRGAQVFADDQGLSVAQFSYWGKDADRTGNRMECTHAFVEHMLALAEFRLAVETAARQQGIAIPVWHDEMTFRREQLAGSVRIKSTQSQSAKEVKNLPDGYFVLEPPDGRRGHFFVEVDRGTESIRDRWQTKILAYKALFTSGLFRQRFAVANPTTAFRVLVTAPSPTRALNLKAAFERYGDASLSGLFLVAPLSVVLQGGDSVTGRIWLRGGATEPEGLL